MFERSETDEKDINFDTCIVIGTQGFVWVAKRAKRDPCFLHMGTARQIRQWGTNSGLNELINGPTGTTVLDAPAPIVSLAWQAVVAIIPCVDAPWDKHLKG